MRLPLRRDRLTRYVYCDESGVSHKYFVLGAIFYNSRSLDLNLEIEKIKAAHSLRGEVKWEKLPTKNGKYFDGYKALIRLFCEFEISFKALIVNTEANQINHPDFAGSSYAIGYYQFYSLLLFNGVMKDKPSFNHRVTLHTPQYDSVHLTPLENGINLEAREYGFDDMVNHNCCTISSSSSKDCPSIQLTDILTGMLSASWNNSANKPIKREFIKEFEDLSGIRLGRASLSRREERKFNQWLFTPKI